MKEKKTVKISLWTLISIIIIGILIIISIFAYSFGYIKGKETRKEMEQKTIEVEEKIDKLIKQKEEKDLKVDDIQFLGD